MKRCLDIRLFPLFLSLPLTRLHYILFIHFSPNLPHSSALPSFSTLNSTPQSTPQQTFHFSFSPHCYLTPHSLSYSSCLPLHSILAPQSTSFYSSVHSLANLSLIILTSNSSFLTPFSFPHTSLSTPLFIPYASVHLLSLLNPLLRKPLTHRTRSKFLIPHFPLHFSFLTPHSTSFQFSIHSPAFPSFLTSLRIPYLPFCFLSPPPSSTPLLNHFSAILSLLPSCFLLSPPSFYLLLIPLLTPSPQSSHLQCD